jgi:hypothetical protein
MIITKDITVHFKKFSPAIMAILNALYALNEMKATDFPEDFIITSANDSTSHSAKSKHYQDMALDIRSKNFKSADAKKFFIDRLLLMLPKGKFTILLENAGLANEHFHIQVKKGVDYP